MPFKHTDPVFLVQPTGRMTRGVIRHIEGALAMKVMDPSWTQMLMLADLNGNPWPTDTMYVGTTAKVVSVDDPEWKARFNLQQDADASREVVREYADNATDEMIIKVAALISVGSLSHVS